jgi:hypothetical protein
MRYLLMMNTMKAGQEAQSILTWPKQDIQAHLAHTVKLNQELASRGELVSAEGLCFPNLWIEARPIMSAAPE